ncbi:25-hydroxycholesterol 7-alpha-hydroxylase [Colletotrichum spaethianum]|uniref:25-hydroxycholesterol 7-alpha-hydroxylase n=1 Tax=Colletotrichum spaethianum TaxID=700344 RepID=A0AA37PEH3_9PEZI|nr:25-hydroxycholesterol 7-alpha-hydroxylase [Colletotrichum spaethianum]GKT50810.1 25-hydroxycholesterol 7-alpha-hydroxylase [Colletotrichum spaethianum]
MAGNDTAKAGSFLAFLVGDIQESTSSYVTVAVLMGIAILVHKFSSPEMDAREPPSMKPRIPVIGHLIGMIRHQSSYFKTLENRKMAAATLPILNGKVYGIWDPVLIQSVYRNRDLSFEPFAVEFAQRELGFNNATLKIIQESTLVPEFFDGIHKSMTADNLHRMNANALAYVSNALDNVCKGSAAFEATNFFVWVRDLMTMATAEALYGPNNPLRKDASLMEDTWIFEADLPILMLGVAPSITARRCYNARQRLQAALSDYYGNDRDYHEDASQIVKNRAAALRNHGISGEQVGIFELALLHVATSNTIPTLFWFMAYVFSQPELVARLRDEVLPVAQRSGNGEVTIDIGTVDERCPLLVSCYREAIRMSNQGMGNRRVMEDTTISDGKGRTYLLKKGCNVQMSAQVTHRLEQSWGPDSASFVPDRFVVKSGKENAESEKMKRASFIAFGGGRHLCPGRNFAFAENLGFVASLLAGFDVSPLDENMKETHSVPIPATCSMTGAVVKPADNGAGYGVRVRRREGWENVKWRYIS